MNHKALIFAAMALLLAAPAQAQNSGPPASAPSSISREGARTIIEATIAYARDTAKSRMAVVILDNSGHLVSSDRMDGASFHLEKFARGGIAGLPEGVDEKAALSGLEAFERSRKR